MVRHAVNGVIVAVLPEKTGLAGGDEAGAVEARKLGRVVIVGRGGERLDWRRDRVSVDAAAPGFDRVMTEGGGRHCAPPADDRL